MTSLDRRQRLFNMGTARVIRFCSLNNIVIPKMLLGYVDGNTGMYFPGEDKLIVDLGMTALEATNPAHMRWSWPGWKTDRTACGVVAHETGHHVEYVLAKAKRYHRGLWRTAMKGKRVSGYEPYPHEAFAETMRVFILNPELLQLSIPNRYDYIVNVLGLKPSETRSWKEVIENENYFPAAEKWIAAK